jgi:transcriptional regulator PpsR
VNLFPIGSEQLADIKGEFVSQVVAATGDLVLIVDHAGVILDAALNNSELERQLGAIDQWIGHLWIDRVTHESRAKVESLLHHAIEKKPRRWVQVNHPSKGGPDIPVAYTAIDIGGPGAGRVVAIARDLHAMSILQQKLVDAQQSMERDYLRLRHVETRYRLLFQMSSEAVLIVDPSNQRILDANPSALALLGANVKQLAGRPFAELFDSESRAAIEALLALVGAAGHADEVAAKSASDNRDHLVSASLFRQDNSSFFLVRVLPARVAIGTALSTHDKALLKAIDLAPDGFVLTNFEGRILVANQAFCDIAQLPGQEQARAGSLDQWLGRPGVDMSVMLATLRQRGTLSLFATTMRGEYGESTPVEISAASVMNDGKPCYGFVIRNVGRRIPADSRVGKELPRSVEQLTELIGRVPLKDLVREATDMIERLCIQAALELTGDNRASAAELLGLSRQSLYVKLRRHGLGDLNGDDQDQGEV